MPKLVLTLLFISSLLHAAEWSYSKEIRLSKDQMQTVLVKEEAMVRVLKFRWTLFAGEGLVMHLNYNERASQFILYKHYKKDTYRVELLPKVSAFKRVPYLYLTFKKFDHKTSKAHFEIVIDDPEKRALIELKESV